MVEMENCPPYRNFVEVVQILARWVFVFRMLLGEAWEGKGREGRGRDNKGPFSPLYSIGGSFVGCCVFSVTFRYSFTLGNIFGQLDAVHTRKTSIWSLGVSQTLLCVHPKWNFLRFSLLAFSTKTHWASILAHQPQKIKKFHQDWHFFTPTPL